MVKPQLKEKSIMRSLFEARKTKSKPRSIKDRALLAKQRDGVDWRESISSKKFSLLKDDKPLVELGRDVHEMQQAGQPSRVTERDTVYVDPKLRGQFPKILANLTSLIDNSSLARGRAIQKQLRRRIETVRAQIVKEASRAIQCQKAVVELEKRGPVDQSLKDQLKALEDRLQKVDSQISQLRDEAQKKCLGPDTDCQKILKQCENECNNEIKRSDRASVAVRENMQKQFDDAIEKMADEKDHIIVKAREQNLKLDQIRTKNKLLQKKLRECGAHQQSAGSPIKIQREQMVPTGPSLVLHQRNQR